MQYDKGVEMRKKGLIMTVFAMGLGLLLAGAVWAEEPIDGEDTITVFEENQLPGNFDKRIELPERASQRAVERSRHGIDTANQAREMKREFGMERSQEARQEHNRQETGEIMRERARDRIVPPVDRGETGEQVRDGVVPPAGRDMKPQRPETPGDARK
jgi:hypothetical protein